ncbi:pullulanase-type alpha-1,6-glucosidase [Corallincola spongiicola]|uniref:Pullulanase-type alpha-1,6-glucosidase n=1 Tax=Corallincola spongiicola TaxID=2520508 RepID=A0ABY1WR29_9GAMM|nr:pullulanase-type alpha-1,6-glucosidase [Corallincola spongiicola]TAA47174.1 pullulanase-type alpha-1,6-glucosidase [Corallincola spongiicola]
MIWSKFGKALLMLLIAAGLSACNDRKIEDEVFYFVLPDRFHNGDTSNDTGGIEGEKQDHGYDPADKRYYHGGDLNGLIKKLPYLDQMGITAIWMTPVFKNMPTVDNSAGYHGYWTIDYTQIDPHWGSNDELQTLIDKAHKRDIKVFFDIVINHTADVIRFQECHNADGSLIDPDTGCPYRSLDEIASNPYTPFALPGMEAVKVPAWLNDFEYYHNQGDSTFSGENSFNGDFFGLDDLKTEHPDVVNGMVDLFKYWISEYRMDGFRVDTVKHVNIEFWQQWTPAIMAHAEDEGLDDFFVFGEVFEGHPKDLSVYSTKGQLPSVLDFGLYYAIRDVVADSQGTDRLQWIFDRDDYYTDADSNASQLLTFSGNHDVGRIGQQIDIFNPEASEEERLARAELANSILFLARGVPVVYYGDEQGFTGDGNDADAREDMMPSLVEEFNDNDLIGTDDTTADDNFNKRHPLYKNVKALSKLLDKYNGLRRGDQYARYSSATPGIFAFSRMDSDERREYLVAFNTSTEEQSFSTDVDGSGYARIWPKPGEKLTPDADGQLTLTVPALSAVVYLSMDKIAKPDDTPALLFSTLTDGAMVMDRVEVAVTMAHEVPAAYPGLYGVDFEASVDGGDWIFIGHDAAPPYRVYFDATELADGTPVSFRATATNVPDESVIEVTTEIGAVEGMTILFEKPEEWEAPNLYWWAAAPQADTSWPGVTMEHVIENWYQFKFDDGVTSANMIFNDGAGQQTTDLYREGDGCYTIDAGWQDSCDLPEPGITLYFKQPDGWADTINLYYWNAAPADDASWPGVAMELIGEGWYKYQLPTDVAMANMIFNDGSGNQTGDLYHEGDGCYENDAWIVDCEPPQAGIKLYFKKPIDWTDGINLYYWDAAPAPAVDWPGVAMTDEGNDWYSYQMPLNVTMANMIFNDGSGNQTSDLYRDADGCYENSEWIDSCDITGSEPGFTVYVRRPLSWNVPNIYFWGTANDPAWPGAEMTAIGDDWYSYQFADGVSAVNVIFNDLTGNQTTDLYRDADGCYDIETNEWSDSCAIPGFTAYLEKPDVWAAPNLYFWSPGPTNAPNVGWPGDAMTDLGSNWFSYQFPAGVQYANLIFNDGTGQQTSDLFREGDGCYSVADGDWTDSCDYPKPGLKLYFKKPGDWGGDVNLYYWEADPAPAVDWPGAAMTSLGDDWYLFEFPQGVDSANLIFNDGAGNQTTDLFRDGDGCFGEFSEDWRNSCITPDSSTDVEIQNASAHWVALNSLLWTPSDSRWARVELVSAQSQSIVVVDNQLQNVETSVTLSAGASIPADIAEKAPHLTGLDAWSIDAIDATVADQLLKGHLLLAAYDSNDFLLEVTRVQTPWVLDQLYAYDGQLGLYFEQGQPHISVWAPTAQNVQLIPSSDAVSDGTAITASSVANGVWHFVGDASWDLMYYQFEVSVFHHLSDQLETFRVTDPYSVSLSTDSRYSQVVNLNDASLKPAGWDGIQKALPPHSDITVYEGHVRDFSAFDTAVPAAHRGKYLAFTYNGVDSAPLSAGMAHLQALQAAGLSHFHLLPVNDLGSIREDGTMRADLDDPYSKLCALVTTPAVQARCGDFDGLTLGEALTQLKDADPLNAEIQAILYEPRSDAAVSVDGFNWGYDPYHFNALEGSYATDPQGTARIVEFRELVKALDEVDLNVVVDVVYNHTFASGLSNQSVLDKVVPGYYHRRNPFSGDVEMSTCCDNTATEHEMMGKLLTDTLVHWAKHYKIDAFRFDLMGHIPKAVMVEAQATLQTLTLATDGVDGANIYLYGEGWDFGEVSGDQRFEQATQFNMAGTGIGTFNDRLRDAVRGGNFTDRGAAQGFANGNELFWNGRAPGASSLVDQADRIRIGMAGNLQTYPFVDNTGTTTDGLSYSGVGYNLDPQEAVNYVDKHDNETLWDNTQAKLPDDISIAERVRVQALSQSFVNLGQGIPFHQMASDLARSKSMDRNSFDSGDWFNKIDFTKQSNNWAVGLPPAEANEVRWTRMAEIMSNSNTVAQASHIDMATSLFQQQLQLRYDSKLFRLDTAEQVEQRLAYWNTGPDQAAGIIAMSVSDGVCSGNDLDPSYDGILVLFNADRVNRDITLNELPGLTLHSIQQNGADAVVKTASVDGATYSLPALTAAVFVQEQSAAQGEFPCNPSYGAVTEPGFTVYFKKPATWADPNIYYWDTAPESYSVDWPGAAMLPLGDDWFSFEMPAGVESANMIFNDGAGNQTGDLYREGEGCYEADTWSDSCTLPGLSFWFEKPADWTDEVYLYFWGASVDGPGWPGIQMTDLGNGWFFFQLPEGARSTNLIFNDANGSGNQTSDLFRTANGCYSTVSGWSDSCDLP